MNGLQWLDRLKVHANYGIQVTRHQQLNIHLQEQTSGLYGIFGPSENLNQGATLISLSMPI